MAVQATVTLGVSVRETLEVGVDGANAPVVRHDQFPSNITLNGSSAAPVTKPVVDNLALSAGAYTIDLTSMTGTNGAAVNGTGLKVQAIHIRNNGAAAMTITPGSSNPYNLLGSSFSVVLAPGQEFAFYGNEAAPDISGSAKEIDIAGTGTDDFDLSLVMG